MVKVKKTPAEKVKRIINRKRTLSHQEKLFILKYAGDGAADVMNPDGGERLETFAKNLIIIINSFFEYGFRGGGISGVTTTLEVQ